MSNVASMLLHPAPDSSPPSYVLKFPAPERTPIPLFDSAHDTGKFVKAILTHRDSLLGKRVLAATDYYTSTNILDAFTEVKPESAKGSRFERVSEQAFKDGLGPLPEKAKVEMYENMAFMTDFGYYGNASLAESHAVRLLFSCFFPIVL